MPVSSISVFGEPDDYQAALRGDGDVEFVVTGRGEFRAQLTRIALPRLQLLDGKENIARIAFTKLAPSVMRVSLSVRGRAPLFFDGTPARADEVVTHGPGQSMHERSDGPSNWRAILLPAHDLVRYGRAMMGTTFDVPAGACRWRPMPTALRRLTRLFDDAIRMNKAQPRVVVGAEAARGLEQELIDALIECMPANTMDEFRAANLRHANIMSRFENILRASADRTASTVEICAALGISSRTFRACCEDYVGMGPHRYLRLRRLRLARRALLGAEPGATRVSDVARQFGFGGLGRFAAAYRTQFGELPSVTLQHNAGG